MLRRKLTCDGKVPYHLVAPFEEVLHLKTLELSSYGWRQVMLIVAIQRARVFQGLESPWSSPGVSAEDVVVDLVTGRQID